MDKKKLYSYTKVLAIIGIFLSVYLLWQQIFKPAFQPCTISATVNCDAIITGSVSKTLGIPTPLYGLIGYIMILVSSMFYYRRLLLGMALFGMVFCLWIAYQELFLLNVICPVCIGCQVIMIAVFIFALIINRRRL